MTTYEEKAKLAFEIYAAFQRSRPNLVPVREDFVEQLVLTTYKDALMREANTEQIRASMDQMAAKIHEAVQASPAQEEANRIQLEILRRHAQEMGVVPRPDQGIEELKNLVDRATAAGYATDPGAGRPDFARTILCGDCHEGMVLQQTLEGGQTLRCTNPECVRNRKPGERDP